MPSSNPLLDKALPLVLFLAIAVGGLGLIMTHLEDTSFKIMTEMQCPKRGMGLTPFRIAYTGYVGLDEFLCGIVSFFNASMKPEVVDFLNYFFGAGSYAFLFPAVEAARRGTGYFNVLVAFPFITLLIGQVATLGATLPVYWALFLAAGHHNVKQADAVISQRRAESIVFGFLVGIVAPSVAMMSLQTPKAIAFWQPCPLYFYIAQQLYLLVRRQQSKVQSGYRTIKTFYTIFFVISVATHITYLVKRSSHPDGILPFFIPPFHPNRSTVMSVQAINILQWDAILVTGSSILASFWFADSITEVASLLIWHAVMVPMGGPFASVTGVLLWRESKLNGSRGVQSGKLKKVKKE